jgi:deoxyribodipyrimidine photolyase
MTIQLHRKMRTYDNPDLAGATQAFVTFQSLPTEVETVKVALGAFRKKLFLDSSFQDFSRQLESLNVSAYGVEEVNLTLSSDPTLNYASLRRARELVHKNFTSFKKNLGPWSVNATGEPFIDAGVRARWWTGEISNRLRQNTARFLAKSLGIDWTWCGKRPILQ